MLLNPFKVSMSLKFFAPFQYLWHQHCMYIELYLTTSQTHMRNLQRIEESLSWVIKADRNTKSYIQTNAPQNGDDESHCPFGQNFILWRTETSFRQQLRVSVGVMLNLQLKLLNWSYTGERPTQMVFFAIFLYLYPVSYFLHCAF